MATKNILKTQLQTGAIEKPSIASSAKDSGAISVALKSGEMPQLKKRACKTNKHSKTKCDQGAQTELSRLPVPEAMTSVTMVRHAVGDTLQNSL